METCTFEELKEHIRQLNELLEAPQLVDLMSWWALYAAHMQAISDYWVNN